MSDLQEFLGSQTFRHPATWCAAFAAAVYGGANMLSIREAKRAEGQPIQLPTLWMEQTGDVLFGALFQVVFLLCAAWLVWIVLEGASTWLRQSTIVAVYIVLVALAPFI